MHIIPNTPQNVQFIKLGETKDVRAHADMTREEKIVRSVHVRNAPLFSSAEPYQKQNPFIKDDVPNNQKHNTITTKSFHKQEHDDIRNSDMCGSQQQSSSQLNDMPCYISSPSSDDDSVSTLGSTDVPNQHSSKRSIFGNYWGTDMRPSHSPIRKQSLNTLDTEDSTISRYAETIRNSKDWSSYINEEVLNKSENSSKKRDSDGYESYLKMNEAGRTELSSAASLKESLMSDESAFTPCSLPATPSKQHCATRRRIFPNISKQKVTSLPSYGYMHTKPRKGKAPLPYLLHNKKMLRSSLRERITSESFFVQSALSSQSRPTVSFETQVTIHEFENPYQLCVHDGWSDRYCYLTG